MEVCLCLVAIVLGHIAPKGAAWAMYAKHAKSISEEEAEPLDPVGPLKSHIQQARGQLSGGEQPMVGPGVFESTEVHVEIAQHFKAASIATLRKATHQDRTQKTLLSTLPVLNLPDDSNMAETEPYYIFRADTDADFKDVTVRVLLKTSLEKTHLKPDNQMWSKQSMSTYQHMLDKKAEEVGIGSLFQKHKLQSFQEWFDTSYVVENEDV
eukprot:5042376-Amphidinium_carterae.1